MIRGTHGLGGVHLSWRSKVLSLLTIQPADGAVRFVTNRPVVLVEHFFHFVLGCAVGSAIGGQQ
jgi:hypothetical protein